MSERSSEPSTMSMGARRPRSNSLRSQSSRTRRVSGRGWRSVRTRSRCQHAKRAQVQSHGAVPNPDPDPATIPDLDPESAVPAGPTPMPVPAPDPTQAADPAPARKTSGKNPTSTPPRVACVVDGNACMNARADPAFEALFRTTVSTYGNRGRRFFTCTSVPDEEDK